MAQWNNGGVMWGWRAVINVFPALATFPIFALVEVEE